jgi:hypothetical protein
LIAPKAGEAGGGAQFPEFGTLLLRHRQCQAKAILRCGALIHGHQQRSPQPMHFGLGPTLLCGLNYVGGFGKAFEPFVRLRRHSVNLRERHEEKWNS